MYCLVLTKELAASLAVEGKARGVDVHAVHPSPAACSAMSAGCAPSTCHGPVLQKSGPRARAIFWTWPKGCLMHDDSQRLKPCKGKLPLHFWWWQWCQGAQNEYVSWLHVILKAAGHFQQYLREHARLVGLRDSGFINRYHTYFHDVYKSTILFASVLF